MNKVEHLLVSNTVSNVQYIANQRFANHLINSVNKFSLVVLFGLVLKSSPRWDIQAQYVL